MKKISEFKVSLRIYHPNVDPQEIESVLGLKGYNSHLAGNTRTTPKGALLSGVYKYSYWSYALPIPANSLLPSIINEMNKQLSKKIDFLKKLTSSGGKIEYFIGLFLNVNYGECLDWGLLEECANLNINLSFDIYSDVEK